VFIRRAASYLLLSWEVPHKPRSFVDLIRMDGAEFGRFLRYYPRQIATTEFDYLDALYHLYYEYLTSDYPGTPAPLQVCTHPSFAVSHSRPGTAINLQVTVQDCRPIRGGEDVMFHPF
jgi:hypothetical protein